MYESSIWIVHETVHMLLLLRSAITEHGYHNIRCFSHGDEAVALLKQGSRPDVVIADDRLTGMSGEDLLTLADSLCSWCKGILLVSPDANPYASRHYTVVEGAAGFHESLVEVLSIAAHTRYSATAISGDPYEFDQQPDGEVMAQRRET